MPGLTVLPLHEHGPEHVALVRWAPSTRFRRHRHWGGEEILVLDGVRGRARHVPQGQLAAQPASVGAQPVHRT
ncbi:MAG TPA: cupin domain-containing protein [Gemmatimonadales bacterium]|nr:cupin domain-containing protein [Gemmatimonadales bacterium]